MSQSLLPKSKYLEAFKAAANEAREAYHLIGDNLLVEEIPEEELKTKSGLVIATGDRKMIDGVEANRPVFVRVLAVGEGYYQEDLDSFPPKDKVVPLDVQVGDIILVGKLSVAWFSAFGNVVTSKGCRIGRCRESDIAQRFNGEEGYAKYFNTLNQVIEKGDK